MKKVLVVSYSRHGTTRSVADEIATALGAEHREIIDVCPRRGLLGYWRSGLEALARGLPTVRVDFDLADYENIVLGTPVWAGSMASPVRSFLYLYGRRISRPAFFCTLNGYGADRTLDEMMALCDADEALTYSARRRDIRRGRHARTLREFTTQLQRQIGLFPAAA